MANIVVVLVLVAIVTLAITKIIIEKRKGVKCVGCPLSASQKKKSNCGC